MKQEQGQRCGLSQGWQMQVCVDCAPRVCGKGLSSFRLHMVIRVDQGHGIGSAGRASICAHTPVKVRAPSRQAALSSQPSGQRPGKLLALHLCPLWEGHRSPLLLA